MNKVSVIWARTQLRSDCCWIIVANKIAWIHKRTRIENSFDISDRLRNLWSKNARQQRTSHSSITVFSAQCTAILHDKIGDIDRNRSKRRKTILV